MNTSDVASRPLVQNTCKRNIVGEVDLPADARRYSWVDKGPHSLVEVAHGPHFDLKQLSFAFKAEELRNLFRVYAWICQIIIGVRADWLTTDNPPENRPLLLVGRVTIVDELARPESLFLVRTHKDVV